MIQERRELSVFKVPSERLVKCDTDWEGIVKIEYNVIRGYSRLSNKRVVWNKRGVTKYGFLPTRNFIYCCLLSNKDMLDGKILQKQISVQRVYQKVQSTQFETK